MLSVHPPLFSDPLRYTVKIASNLRGPVEETLKWAYRKYWLSSVACLYRHSSRVPHPADDGQIVWARAASAALANMM